MILESLVYEMPQVLWQQELQQAFIPFLVAGALLLGAVGAAVSTSGGDTKRKVVRGRSLVILGMPEAGKTQFLKNLKGEEYSAYETTNAAQEYQPFNYRYGNRTIRIKGGKDIGGGIENIKPYWENLMNRSDIAVFIFDVSKYLKIGEYQRQTNARLEFFYNHLGKKPYAVIASHADKVGEVKKGEETNLVRKLESLVRGKVYASLFQTSLFVCNLTDQSDFSIITGKLFGIS